MLFTPSGREIKPTAGFIRRWRTLNGESLDLVASREVPPADEPCETCENEPTQ